MSTISVIPPGLVIVAGGLILPLVAPGIRRLLLLGLPLVVLWMIWQVPDGVVLQASFLDYELTPLKGDALSRLFATIFAITLAGERPHTVLLVGAAGVVIGLVIATGDSIRLGWSSDRLSILGYFLALVAAASYGGGDVAAKELTEAYGSPLMITAFSLFFGILLLAPIGGRQAVESLLVSGGDLKFTGSAALSGLAATGAVIFLYYALQQGDVTLVAPVASVTPILTLILAKMFISRLERVTGQVLVGTVLTAVGVMLAVLGSTI